MAIMTGPLPRPSPPPPPKPKNRKVPHMNKEIIVEYNGKSFDLEDAFEVFEEICDSTEEIFANMERLFGATDKDISSKVEELKKRMAKNRPDEFNYIPETDQEVEFAKTISRTMDSLDYVKKIGAIVIFLSLFIIGGVILGLVFKSKPEPGTAIKNEVLMKQIDKTPKTGGMNKL